MVRLVFLPIEYDLCRKKAVKGKIIREAVFATKNEVAT